MVNSKAGNIKSRFVGEIHMQTFVKLPVGSKNIPPVSLGWRSRCLASVLISRSKIGVSTPNSFKGIPTVYK